MNAELPPLNKLMFWILDDRRGETGLLRWRNEVLVFFYILSLFIYAQYLYIFYDFFLIIRVWEKIEDPYNHMFRRGLGSRLGPNGFTTVGKMKVTK